MFGLALAILSDGVEIITGVDDATGKRVGMTSTDASSEVGRAGAVAPVVRGAFGKAGKPPPT